MIKILRKYQFHFLNTRVSAFFSAYLTLLKRKLVCFWNPGFVVMLELLIRDLKASITVHCQQLESYSIAFAEEHITYFFLDVSNTVMWTADTGLAAFVFYGLCDEFILTGQWREKVANRGKKHSLFLFFKPCQVSQPISLLDWVRTF